MLIYLLFVYSLRAIVRFGMNYTYINFTCKIDIDNFFFWCCGEILITRVGLIDSLTNRRPSF